MVASINMMVTSTDMLMLKTFFLQNDAGIMNNYLQGLPLVILFQPAASLSEKDSMRLKDTI